MSAAAVSRLAKYARYNASEKGRARASRYRAAHREERRIRNLHAQRGPAGMRRNARRRWATLQGAWSRLP